MCWMPSLPASTSWNWTPRTRAWATAACPTPTASFSWMLLSCTAPEGVRTPSLVAKAVMDNTDHVLLVGKDAQTFARNLGFKIEADLNTEKSRKLWLEWKRRTDPSHYPDPKSRADAGLKAALAMAAEGLIDPEHVYGTINCNG